MKVTSEIVSTAAAQTMVCVPVIPEAKKLETVSAALFCTFITELVKLHWEMVMAVAVRQLKALVATKLAPVTLTESAPELWMVLPEKVTPLRISSEVRLNVREVALNVDDVPVVAGTKITKSAVVKVFGRSVMRQGRSSVQSNGATGDRSTT